MVKNLSSTYIYLTQREGQNCCFPLPPCLIFMSMYFFGGSNIAVLILCFHHKPENTLHVADVPSFVLHCRNVMEVSYQQKSNKSM
jgi:hypothetical protein